ncbi:MULTISPECIES: hypothetical protein [unclassified Enterococcus]|uniref:hypothetical protein n=1 Tax=unclassified Enterococcus TaxID=2608891 RepID=UPI001CE19115|nr:MULTISPECIES: hypothetical protein [unclassified Enterococcus]MCA5014037.1 hypothetical protein [Enterococcus sp. S23]MCA5017189.1 hypothetical protein [Enterococcus sp. S22(2020)]
MKDTYDILWEKIIDMGLEEYLLSKGVSEASLKSSKEQFSLEDRELYNYYHYKDRVENDKLVPVKNIEGVSRVVDFSWFNILNYSILGVAQKDYDINIEQSRFLKQLLLLEENNIEGLQNMYNNTGNISFLAFQNEDEIKYFQCIDGNHRSILAKVLGLKTIRASDIYYYEYNAENFRLYNIYKKEETDFLKFLEQTEFKINKLDEFSSGKRIVLDYLDFNEFFSSIALCPFDQYEFKNNPQAVFEMIDRAEEIKKLIERINKRSTIYLHLYTLFPKKIMNLRKYFFSDRVTVKSLAKVIALKKCLENHLN